jgi:hypothetical protein
MQVFIYLIVLLTILTSTVTNALRQHHHKYILSNNRHRIDRFSLAKLYSSRPEEVFRDFTDSRSTPTTRDRSIHREKYPIVQIIKNRELVGEFFCGDDIHSCLSRIGSSIAALVPPPNQPTTSSSATSKQRIRPISSIPTRNIYSDAQLAEVINNDSESSIVFLKIAKSGCRQCLNFDHALSTSYSGPSNIYIVNVDESYIPIYMHSLQYRLTGRFQAMSEVVDCELCSNSGILSCPKCKGLGYLMTGTIAGFCSSCSGMKTIRCPSCGGQCLKCG